MNEIEISGKKTIVEHITEQVVHKTITLDENAELNALFIVRESELSIDIIHKGINSKSHVQCIFISKENQKIDAKINGHLNVNASKCQIYLLSLLGDRSDIHVDGGVNIGKDTHGTSGHLLEENVILGKKVKIKTLPMLDVRSSDVSASHGAKIDRLDEAKLFYMMARGLDQKQAQKLIVEGYINRICESAGMSDESRDKRENANEERSKVVSDILGYFGMGV